MAVFQHFDLTKQAKASAETAQANSGILRCCFNRNDEKPLWQQIAVSQINPSNLTFPLLFLKNRVVAAEKTSPHFFRSPQILRI